MPNAAGGLAVSRLKRPASAALSEWSWLLPKWSPAAAMRAVRATVVLSSVFALALEVIGNLQVATFAAFGSFATLVLASFSGTRRDKLLAHAALAVAGSVFLTIGTAVASSTALAAIVTVPVTFCVFFAGVAGPNAASGVTGALLAYVLPAASPSAVAMIPDRLAGWWLASIAGTAAVLFFSPRPGPDELRTAAAGVARALAAELEATISGESGADRLAALTAAKQRLIAQFTATPYRPTGLNPPDEALANVVELLEWCAALVADAVGERPDVRDAPPAIRELLDAARAVLCDAATLLEGERAHPDGAYPGGAHPDSAGPRGAERAGAHLDLERLERVRAECLEWQNGLARDRADFRGLTKLSFHAHAIALAVLAIGGDVLVVSRQADPAWIAAQRRAWYARPRARLAIPRRISHVAAVARLNASLRSVWLISSVRGSLALAAAVAIADLSSVQHGFWVVLGTLSVLRSNAASTGSTALRALAGTVIGFVIGGALLVAIGGETTALWVALPVALFIAAYAPGTAPFAVGQAAFTVTVTVLFNLLVPVGWQVGVVRIEDVAIGCAVSVLVGCLFWPRGVSAVVGDDLADAFRSGAAYLREAIGRATGSRAAEPDGAPAVLTAASRLDEALRAFIAEQGSKQIGLRELWHLVGGAMRLRLTAYAIANLPRDPDATRAHRDPLAERARTLSAFYEHLAELVGRPRQRAVPALVAPAFGPAEGAGGGAASPASQYGIWLCEHLDHLAEHLGQLIGPAAHLAEIRRRPWWR